MAQKRSAPDSNQKQSSQKRPKRKYPSTAELMERIRLSGVDTFEKQNEDRNRKLALRQRDKDFLTETEKVKARLLELQKSNPNLFNSLFGLEALSRSGTYLAIFRPDEIARWMADAKDDDQRQILKDFWSYTARFRVWLRFDFKKGEFKTPSPFPPHATKYRARLVNGRLELMQPFAPELPYEAEYEDGNLSVPEPAVEKWLAGGRAVLVRLEDAEGYSVLNEIESFAYDPSSLTLIVHDGGVMPYLFLLVGEMATVEDVRAAAKVLTALHKRLYGRSKAGAPKKVKKMVQRIDKVTAKDGKSQKEKAAELEPSAPSRATEVTLSKTKKTIQPRPTR